MFKLFSDLDNLDELPQEAKDGLIKLLKETLRLTLEEEEYKKYLSEGGNLSRKEWKELRLK